MEQIWPHNISSLHVEPTENPLVCKSITAKRNVIAGLSLEYRTDVTWGM